MEEEANATFQTTSQDDNVHIESASNANEPIHSSVSNLNQNEHMEVENPEDQPVEINENETNEPENQKVNAAYLLDDEDGDSGSQCTICYSQYSNSGEHRLSCLKCGHLFGLSCIQHWLRAGCHYTNRRCPTCNKRAAIRDIRTLYTRNVIATDTAEIYKLQEQVQSVQTEKNKVEAKLHHANLKIDMQEKEIKVLNVRVDELQQKISQNKTNELASPVKRSQYATRIEINSINLSSEGGCRVLAYSRDNSLLVASHSSGSPLFPGSGIRKINSFDMTPSNFYVIHKKTIRDVVFHRFQQNMILTVSVEGCAKLFDTHNNTIVGNFAASDPLWSCCWSENEPYKFYCGSQTGVVYAYDQRQPEKEVEIALANTRDKTGVIALCSVQSKPGRVLPRGGVLVCKLNCVYAFGTDDGNTAAKVLPIEGNFMSMRFNNDNDHILLSARPGARWPSARHMLYRLSHNHNREDLCEPVHIFYGSHISSSVLSRSTFVNNHMNGSKMVAAHNVAKGVVDLWDLTTTNRIPANMRLSEPILDMCSINIEDGIFLPCLSDKKLSVIKISS